MDRNDFFTGLGSDEGAYDDKKHGDENEFVAARRALNRLAYEERTIKRAFRECGVKVNGWGRIANECRAATGKDKLNFDWFNAAFPVFRGYQGSLSGARIPHLHEITVADLFKPTSKNRLYRSLMRALPNAPFVFVFPIVRTMFVAHSNAVDPVKDSVQLVFETDPTIYVQASWSYFAAVGNEWAVRT